MRRSDRSTPLALPVSPRRDHIRGPVDAPLTLVEYGDFECPSCRAAHDVVEDVRAQLGDQVRFVYRHFPLTSLHRHAERAAQAAEAAARQGAFWPMHDGLFAHQDRLTDRDLLTLASSIGLELEEFGDDLMRHVHATHVRDDFTSGVRSGVAGTPTFFVNGVRHDLDWDATTLIAALERDADVEV
jgi:protein-disulfide isomerase